MENTQMKPAEMLEQVNKAIAAVLVGGQSYKIGSRSLTRADLSGHPLPPAGSDLCGLL